MPTRPLSNAQRQGRTAQDRSYDRTVRQADPALAHAKQVRSSGRWRKVRALVLAAQPVCADIWGWHAAAGRVVLATQVDHIVGLREGGAAFAVENLQPLCLACHNKKSSMERASAICDSP